MAIPADIIFHSAIEALEDESLALKFANGGIFCRIFSRITDFLAWLTNVKDPKTGEVAIDVDPETAEYFRNVAILNEIGLPWDASYAVFLNAKDGNTKDVAKEPTTLFVAVTGLFISAIGSIIGFVYNIIWQSVLWIKDIMDIDYGEVEF